MPATFVVDGGGMIRAAFVEPDCRRRTDPQAALNALLSAAA
jgi:peroxiredoxin